MSGAPIPQVTHRHLSVFIRNNAGELTKTSHYLFEKRGYYYFSRRIPSDLRGSYKTLRVVLSLKTKSLNLAHSRAISLSSKLEEEWHTLRFLN
ncbi:DUF6538 domain-containing protein [Maritalea myrionectae]|uniref:DUF6538 domain-containing protein n=1 Tax=Maritalea myrionectae TaxID=454601 RepID=UPI003CCFEEF7